MNPDPTDPDIVPVNDGADCSSEILWVRVGHGVDVDHIMMLPWEATPDTLDTGSPE